MRRTAFPIETMIAAGNFRWTLLFGFEFHRHTIPHAKRIGRANPISNNPLSENYRYSKLPQAQIHVED